MNASQLNIEGAVTERYSQASLEAEAALCCPVDYDARWLEVLPAELIDRDYGCGDPSQWVQQGDHVLDLGSGGGKICYIASQVVGADGRVTGVDMNENQTLICAGDDYGLVQLFRNSSSVLRVSPERGPLRMVPKNCRTTQ